MLSFLNVKVACIDKCYLKYVQIFSLRRNMLPILCYSDIEGIKEGNLKTFVGKLKPDKSDLANHKRSKHGEEIPSQSRHAASAKRGKT